MTYDLSFHSYHLKSKVNYSLGYSLDVRNNRHSLSFMQASFLLKDENIISDDSISVLLFQNRFLLVETSFLSYYTINELTRISRELDELVFDDMKDLQGCLIIQNFSDSSTMSSTYLVVSQPLKDAILEAQGRKG